MEGESGASFRDTLIEKLAESLTPPPSGATARRTSGDVRLPGKATAIIGMRRAGKTTFAHQLRRERVTSGLPPEHLPYFNLEDERLLGIDAAQLGTVVAAHARRFPDARTQGPVVWTFDEIQVVPGWERLVRRLLDTDGHEVVVTGSSAALLSREVATTLRGRAWQVLIHPFSFAELLDHLRLPMPDDPAFLNFPDRARLEHAFTQWLDTGGFPEAQGLDAATRSQLLRDYVDVAVLRDVVERHAVSNVVGLKWLVRHLLGNAGGPFSAEKFHHALKSQGIAIARDTVHHLLAYLEDCFLVRTVWMESTSERQRMVNPRKAYPVDTGLIPVFDRTGRANTGHALETAVLIELERRRCEVTYVKTRDGFEVDFFARAPTGDDELIQVSADLTGPGTLARELRALQAAGQQHPHATQRLLTLSQEVVPASVPPHVHVQPAYEWMLSAHA